MRGPQQACLAEARGHPTPDGATVNRQPLILSPPVNARRSAWILRRADKAPPDPFDRLQRNRVAPPGSTELVLRTQAKCPFALSPSKGRITASRHYRASFVGMTMEIHASTWPPRSVRFVELRRTVETQPERDFLQSG